MATSSQRYRKHDVWESLEIKLESLKAARFGDAQSEQWRKDVIEWLTEAQKTKFTRLPALYLGALNDLSAALNELPSADAEFKRYVSVQRQPQNPQKVWALEAALRSLPLPPPKELTSDYVELLDREIEVRTARLDELEEKVSQTESALQSRRDELSGISDRLAAIDGEIGTTHAQISEVSSSAEDRVNTEWAEALNDWKQKRQESDETHDAQALEHVATLAATAKTGNSLAEHAAGDLSAADWKGRAKRERKAAQWIRWGAIAVFMFAGAFGWFIVSEAIRNNFDLTFGDGVLRASVALVIGAFGALLLREAGRHFREADTAEDVALSLQALAPFYAGSTDNVRVDARKQVGDAVLVKNVLSRFAHRDAAKHAADVDGSDLAGLVDEAKSAFKQNPDNTSNS